MTTETERVSDAELLNLAPLDREVDGVLWLRQQRLLRDAACRAAGGCTPSCRERLRRERYKR